MSIAQVDRNEWSISSPLHNRLAEEDRPIHGWYRFVLSFPPHLVREYLNKFDARSGQTILDPFCGTGTTLVESKLHGIRTIGIEANPVAALASAVKTNWSINPHDLRRTASKIGREAQRFLPAVGSPPDSQLVCEQPTLYGTLDLTEEQNKLILQGSISPMPLHRTLYLRSLIESSDPGLRDHQRIALAWTIVNTASNLRFGPEVGVTSPKQDADVVADWVDHVERMAKDLSEIQRFRDCESIVHMADARTIPSEIPDCSVDLVFTSPPYPNEKDYTRTTRLESVILGYISSKQDLRNLKRGLIRSNTRNVYITDADDLEVQFIPEIQRLASEIEKKRIELGKTSGFERLYHRVTKLYFGGMARHFRELRRVLKPGALLGYVVGDQASYLRVMIRTGELIGQIAEREGFELVGIDLFRTRYATATKEQLREEVVILRWPGA